MKHLSCGVHAHTMFHVKHQTDRDEARERVLRGAEQLGVPLSEAQAETMCGHLQAVLEANERLNLTAVRTLDEGIGRHVLDSLAAVPMLESCPAGEFVDLGSGAGFPGIPLCVASGREAVLAESIRKKAAFLSEIAERLAPRITVAAVRSEELALTRPCAFAAVVARAVAPLATLVELAAPLLAADGRLIALKGPDVEGEVERSLPAAAVCGLVLYAVEQVSVPEVHGSRTLVSFLRVGDPEVKLPRRPGMAAKRPLG
ncbi:MAG: 16S rRNA (guanine(527)-N(7))-methyltransferase RsmG [Actinobacteria bacterium]|nr:MAG: 16S rRNA (guanine(527)-N(7))-methyltransferase RsmG [Actinomycetota bacterium]